MSDISGVTLTAQQHTALDAVTRWWGDEQARAERPVFRLFGYAGTGKTTIARLLPQTLNLPQGDVTYCAFTGKATSVLRSKGCQPAHTIHSLIYQPAEKSRKELHEARWSLAKSGDPVERMRLETLITQLEDDLAQPSFKINRFGLDGVALLVIDEVSMIGDRIGTDLLSFNVPIIALGDPAQLPPVDGDNSQGYFMRAPADVTLTEVRRQEADSPVLDLATRIRDGRGAMSGDYLRGTLPLTVAADPAGQVLVGRNVTRWDINTRVRHALGRQAGRPEPGDRVVCLANSSHLGLFNGETFTVVETAPGPADATIRLLLDDLADEPSWVTASLAGFVDFEAEQAARRDCFRWRDKALMTWAYALTTHKAQGSQWDHVLVIDESHVFRADAARWLYTGVTRAAKTVVLGSADNLQ